MGGNAAGPRVPSGLERRASDSGSAGGNAYSGATSDVSGGSVVNEADDQGTVTNNGGSKSNVFSFSQLDSEPLCRHCWCGWYNVLR